MAGIIPGLSANTKTRYGTGPCQDVPLQAAELVEETKIDAANVTVTPTSILDASLSLGGMRTEAQRGKFTPVGGPLELAVIPEGQLPIFTVAQRAYTTTEPETGVFVHDLDPGQANDASDQWLTMEIDYDEANGAHLFYGGKVVSLTFAWAPSTLLTCTAELLFSYWHKQGDGVPSLVNPGTGPTGIRGMKPTAPRRALSAPHRDTVMELVDISDPDAVTVRAKTGPSGFHAGTLDVTTGTAAVTGTGTLFTKEMQEGDHFILDVLTVAEGASVLSIESDTALTLTAPASNTHTGVTAFADFGASPILSTGKSGEDSKGAANYFRLYDSRTGDPMGVENGIEAHVDLTGLTTADIALAGTIDITGTAVTGTGTAFDTELAVGDAVTVPGDTERRIVAIGGPLAATLDASHAGASGASGTVKASYRFPMVREDWAKTVPTALPYTEVVAEITVDGDTFKMDTLTVTATAPVVEQGAIGGMFNGVVEQGFRDIQFAGTRQQTDAVWQEALYGQESLDVSIFARDLKRISDPADPFRDRQFILSLAVAVPSGPTLGVTGADDRTETLAAQGYLRTAADLSIQVQTDRATALSP